MGLQFTGSPLYPYNCIDKPVTFTYRAILWVIFWEWIGRRKIATTSTIPTLMQYTLQYFCSLLSSRRSQIYAALYFAHVNSVLIPR